MVGPWVEVERRVWASLGLFEARKLSFRHQNWDLKAKKVIFRPKNDIWAPSLNTERPKLSFFDTRQAKNQIPDWCLAIFTRIPQIKLNLHLCFLPLYHCLVEILERDTMINLKCNKKLHHLLSRNDRETTNNSIKQWFYFVVPKKKFCSNIFTE